MDVAVMFKCYQMRSIKTSGGDVYISSGFVTFVKQMDGNTESLLSFGENCWIVEGRVSFWEDLMIFWNMLR